MCGAQTFIYLIHNSIVYSQHTTTVVCGLALKNIQTCALEIKKFFQNAVVDQNVNNEMTNQKVKALVLI